jgi:PUB domain
MLAGPAQDVLAVMEDLQHAAALFLSAGVEESSVRLLARLLQNVLLHPSDPKYRRLRLANPKIQGVVDLPGATELLQACALSSCLFEGRLVEGTAFRTGLVG